MDVSRIGVALTLLAAATLLLAAQVQHSALWGARGEKWTPAGRLPDFSFAGYQRGDRAIPAPDMKSAVSVRDFGAVGDGERDDSDAFLNALASVGRGVIYVPPGRYRITKIIEIRKPGLVIVGAGPTKTTLYFPVPLENIRPNPGRTTGGRPTSNYSWSGGFFWFIGDYSADVLAEVRGDARRGDTTLTVSSTAQLRPRQWVEIFQRDDAEDSLAAHLYSEDPGPTGKLGGTTTASLVAAITAIDGNVIHIDRPLRFDVRARWAPRLRRFAPTVTEAGIEHLAFEFPNTPYAGHFTEAGFNAVAFTRVAHCWVRNVRVVNPDSGLFIAGKFNTVRGIVFESERPPDPERASAGHHGIYLSDDDNLFTDFDFRMKFIHDISLSHCGGNVISDGRGVDLTFDHHKRAPYENLFTNIDAGLGTRLWVSGGGEELGKHCGARGTFWNIRARNPLGYPPEAFGPPSMNLVAFTTAQPSLTEPEGRWFEAIPPGAIEPQNLYRAQLTRRQARHRPSRLEARH